MFVAFLGPSFPSRENFSQTLGDSPMNLSNNTVTMFVSFSGPSFPSRENLSQTFGDSPMNPFLTTHADFSDPQLTFGSFS